MKKLNLKQKFGLLTRMSLIVVTCVLFSLKGMAQTALFFSKPTTDYIKSYTFDSGDKVYFTQGKNTNESATCKGSSGELRPYRIQEKVLILELKSTAVKSLRFYGKSISNTDRIIHKIEVSSSRTGNYKDVTSSANIVNDMRNGKCGILSADNLDIPKGSFVKVTFTLPDDTSVLAPINISEVYLN